MRRSDQLPEVNAGSMADIAFLLLIFFLVTATISSDEGINRLLPKDCPPGMDCNLPKNERNILRIMVNNNDDIMVENEVISLENLKDITKNFLDNNGDGTCNYCQGNKSETASDNPQEAIVSLQNGSQTSYKQFIAVQNELTKAYFELRNAYCENVLKKSSKNLTNEELKKVKEAYPFLLSEASVK